MVTQSNRLENPVSFPKEQSEWYSCLAGNVEWALDVREYIDDLRTSATTFKAKRLPEGSIRVQDRNGVLKLMGAWKAPNTLFKKSGTYVNPNATDAHHYSDVVVRCDCGAPVMRKSFGKEHPQPGHVQEHTNECNDINKAKARLQLLENRKRIVREQYYYNHSPRQSAQRLGYKNKDSMDYGGLYELGLDIHQLERDSRKRMARTCIVLSREYSYTTIAKLFDVGRTAIARMLKHETTANADALTEVRRARV